MKNIRNQLLISLLIFGASLIILSFARPGMEFMIYQFPREMTPSIDGDFSEWEMVPDSFYIGSDQLVNTVLAEDVPQDPADYDLKVKVGWVKGLNRLYFYLEAYDDYWDFEDPALAQDIFELVVDADLSGGNFINSSNLNKNKLSAHELHFKGHGGHAQNYHIFTPVKDKDWAMIWGNAHWIKDFPHMQVAYDHQLQPGDSGTLKMEFYITPFDYASPEGFESSIVSSLKESELIGLSWLTIEYDGTGKKETFRNLAHDIRMIRDASYLCAFRLMPLEEKFRNDIDANWAFTEVDRDKSIIQFMDRSEGEIVSWFWDFGDGTSSTIQHPQHTYDKEGNWTVILTVQGPGGKSVRSKVWDVVTK